jgi:hypothetical protein
VTFEERLQRGAIVVGRLGLGLLLLGQLGWKRPPRFGCGPDFAFTTAGADGALQRGEGLCDWIGLESVYAGHDRTVLGVNIRPLAKLNGAFVDAVVKPNIRFFGWAVFLGEAFIAASMLAGLLSRLGALLAILLAAELLIGLGGIPKPYVWEWLYLLMLILSVVLFGLAPGRVLGLDAWLRPRLARAAARGHRAARIALLMS